QYQVQQLIRPYSLININVPNRPWEEIKGLQLAELGLQKYTYDVVAREDTRGKHYFWLGGSYEGAENIPGSDGNAVAEGWAALTIQTFEVWNFITHDEKALAKDKIAEKLKQ